MVESVIGSVTALRWHLPVKTSSDQATQDRMESTTIDVGHDGIRRATSETKRVAHVASVVNGDLVNPERSNADFDALHQDQEQPREATGRDTARADQSFIERWNARG